MGSALPCPGLIDIFSSDFWTPGAGGVLARCIPQGRIPGYTYDAAGNLTFDGNNTYTYDAENRIIQVNGLAGTWSYVYDGDGECVEKCAGTSCSTTATLYWRSALDGATLSESDLNVNFTSSYVLVNGKPIGRLDNPSDSAVYYLDDHLGSTSVILDSSANIVSESDYYPYGGEIPIITGDPNHYKFTGKERDSETGLDNFGARYYGSNFGRFMTPDWAARATAVPYAVFGDPQSLNLYGYVRNDPVSQVDADGHDCQAPGIIQNPGTKYCPSGEARCNEPKDCSPFQQNESKPAPAKKPSPPAQPEKQPSWDPSKPLPKDPSGLGPDWKLDPQHDPQRKSGDDRYVNDKTGDKVDWHKGQPGAKGEQAKDHWHWVPGGEKEKTHYKPGDMIKNAGIAAGAGATAGMVHAIIETAPEWVPWVAALSF